MIFFIAIFTIRQPHLKLGNGLTNHNNKIEMIGVNKSLTQHRTRQANFVMRSVGFCMSPP